MEEQLFNGEYFFQKTEWRGLRAPYPREDDDSPTYPEFLELAKRKALLINTAQGVCRTACWENGFP